MTAHNSYISASDQPVELIPVNREQLGFWLKSRSAQTRDWVKAHRFTAAAHSCCVIPAEQGGIDCVLYGAPDGPDVWTLSAASQQLPQGDYRLNTDWNTQQTYDAALGWGLGAYRYERYCDRLDRKVRLLVATGLDGLLAELGAITLVRDLINTPPDDLMPEDLAIETRKLAQQHGAEFEQWIGDELLEENFPSIHAVGRASSHAPRLLQLQWGNCDHPRIALVGKGVCFDSGGLDIKPAAGMRLMQKDMGGAAHVLGLAALIMAKKLPVRLQVLIPAVENAIAGNAFHPGDILQTRSGLTVEIENTDAEGRLVLSDALTEACHQEPELVIDFATLTGAARVAVGTEIACFFSSSDDLAEQLSHAAASTQDPVWRLPLHQPYNNMLKSNFADVMNCSKGGFGGAITAALFLQRFVSRQADWLHFDVMAWNLSARPGHPEGGEAMGIRAVYQLIESRWRT